MQDLVEEAADQRGSDVQLGEEQRQAGVACLSQSQALLVLLVDAVATQHALKKLRKTGGKIKMRNGFSRVREQLDVLRLEAHLEDEFPETVRVLVVEQQRVARVGGAGFEEEQEELVPGRAALQEAEQQLQQATQLQHKRRTSENPQLNMCTTVGMGHMTIAGIKYDAYH